ncbi:TerD family protein [Streptomyces sp. NPDC090108]|uniref:TerD family protein n=1 Tax=Streptomyces sp. NPDC090108 TaxID=3365947 RepID=UPI0038097E81
MWPGQTLRLPRAGNGAVEVLRVETSWIGQRPRGLLRRFREPSDLDLDASAVCFSQGQPVDVVFFRHLVSDDGSIRHSGDSLTTPGPTSESITVDLARVPVHVDAVVFTLNSFTGLTFAEVRTVTLRLFDDTAGRELAACALPANGTSTAYVLAKLSRLGTDWQVTALQVPANGRTFQDLMPAIIPLL